MSVSNQATINCSLVTSWNIGFLPSVINILTISLLCQVAYHGRPVISGTQCHRLNDLTISQQVNGNLSWANAILIIVVDPLLRDRLRNSCRRVGVGNRVTINCSFITIRHISFFNRVADLLTSLVYWQVSPATGPVAISRQFNGLDNLTISQQVNLDAGWT